MTNLTKMSGPGQVSTASAPREPGAEHDPAFSRRVPTGDNLPRDICDRCGFIHYVNPKVVVGSVVSHEGRILLCRRAIEPRRGFWTLPAGFMEQGETAEEGARREAREEANAEIALKDLLAVYSIPRIAQVQLMYRAELSTPSFSAGEESLEVALFSWEEIPWEELAFPSVHWALTQFRSVEGQAGIVPFSNPDGETGNLFPRPPR
ncbi:MAG: NUDIX hydrolase [Parvibaculum sp.]|uniref:NUDIX hydrolase n=1 Tax=Parvibaculum sp. TaxID=2024848 RepID=UPI00272042D6|nr:NUDIX hydrolase [Parvibaculum sp.]MDO8837717.1 NUDIX hydrolase [Parvibaculum sp.]